MFLYVKGLYWSLLGSRRSTQTLQDTYAAAVTVGKTMTTTHGISHLLRRSCTSVVHIAC